MRMTAQRAAETAYMCTVTPAQERKITPYMRKIAKNGLALNDDLDPIRRRCDAKMNKGGRKTREKVIGALFGGDMTAFQIAEVTNLSENTVTNHLRKLAVAGLAVVVGEYMSSDRKGGPAPRLFALTPEGRLTE